MVYIDDLDSDDEPVIEEEEPYIPSEEPKATGPVEPPNKVLTDAIKKKEIGKGAYKVGNYTKAIQCWTLALESIEEMLGRDPFKDDEDKLKTTNDLITTLNLNLSQGHLKNKEFRHATEFCDKVLEKAPQNNKALYRKASAQIMGSLFDDARATLYDLLKLDPGNAGALQLMVDIRKSEKASKETSKLAAKKMFAKVEADPRTIKPPPPPEEPLSWSDSFEDYFYQPYWCPWCRRRNRSNADKDD